MDQGHLDNWLNHRKERRSHLTADELFSRLRNGERAALSSAITLLESTKDSDRLEAAALVEKCMPHSGNSIRIGITGVPGVGKSTFIESFGKQLIEAGKKVAVLAVDPSSASSGGSILGDKTRMTELSAHPSAFIRPSAAGTTLGGVARKSREVVFLCEAAGYDAILIETVGVGQSETLVHSMVDFFLLLMLSGAGDELQGIKRGIMELADALVITKADGDNVKRAQAAAREYAVAMHVFPPKQSKWTATTMTCSALENKDISKVLQTIYSFENVTRLNGWFEDNRQLQEKYWLREALQDKLVDTFFSSPNAKRMLAELEGKVIRREMSAFHAADELFRKITGNERGI